MTELAELDAYGAVTEPATLTLRRLLPGPIDRVWAYLTQSDLRRQWLASGDMRLEAGAPFEFTWHNDAMSDTPGQRPEGIPEVHSLQSRITEIDPPRKLAIAWGESGGVSFELEPKGDEVLLTLIHRRAPNRGFLLSVSAGWHVHLDALAARLKGERVAGFWDRWTALKQDYAARFPEKA